MIEKRKITIFIFILICIINVSTTCYKSKIDQVKIYSLPLLSTYLVEFDCDEVKLKKDVSLEVVKDKKKIKRIYDAFFIDSKRNIVDSLSSIAHRSLIEFSYKGEIIKQVCLNSSGHYYENGKVFSPEKNIMKVLDDESTKIGFIVFD